MNAVSPAKSTIWSQTVEAGSCRSFDSPAALLRSKKKPFESRQQSEPNGQIHLVQFLHRCRSESSGCLRRSLRARGPVGGVDLRGATELLLLPPDASGVHPISAASCQANQMAFPEIPSAQPACLVQCRGQNAALLA